MEDDFFEEIRKAEEKIDKRIEELSKNPERAAEEFKEYIVWKLNFDPDKIKVDILSTPHGFGMRIRNTTIGTENFLADILKTAWEGVEVEDAQREFILKKPAYLKFLAEKKKLEKQERVAKAIKSKEGYAIQECPFDKSTLEEFEKVDLKKIERLEHFKGDDLFNLLRRMSDEDYTAVFFSPADDPLVYESEKGYGYLTNKTPVQPSMGAIKKIPGRI